MGLVRLVVNINEDLKDSIDKYVKFIKLKEGRYTMTRFLEETLHEKLDSIKNIDEMLEELEKEEEARK
jgi:hypothetical protein